MMMMKPIILFSLLLKLSGIFTTVKASQDYTLNSGKVTCTVDGLGNLVLLKNNAVNINYASGAALWRLYFDTREEREILVLSKENKPQIRQQNDRIVITYKDLQARNKKLNITLTLELILEDNGIRFASKISNNQQGIIVRELQYPLVGNIQGPADHELLTTERGGNIYADVKKQIGAMEFSYRGPDHHYRQMNVVYPKRVASNCFAFLSSDYGLYFGSHDENFVYTTHGIRLYPGRKGDFNQLELGLYKYPNCQNKETWSNSSNVIYPYQGSWHQTAKFYREWVNTWWEAETPPVWVKEMVGFQRIILRHQYGETFFSYKDFGTKVKDAAQSTGIRVGFPFGWWSQGMDNGYPDSYYKYDKSQGGRQGWKKAIATYKEDGSKLILYYNGKLIDTESKFYKEGTGNKVSFKNSSGNEMNEFYLFPAEGTFTGFFNKRSFVVADPKREEWKRELYRMADDAIDLGADMVFYDQMGYAEDTPDWIIDPKKEFAVPRLDIIKDKAETLKAIRKYIHQKDPSVSLGIEHITDVTSQYVDFTHGIFAKGASHTGSSHMNFIDWFRYTFPEVVLSARDVDGDEKNLKWLINRGVLLGLRHNLAVHRLRSLVTERPFYQTYLAQVNTLVEQHKELILAGRFCEREGFTSSNDAVEARSFTNGNKMAIVCTHPTNKAQLTKLKVPGYKLVNHSQTGNVVIDKQGTQVEIPIDALAILIFEKNTK